MFEIRGENLVIHFFSHIDDQRSIFLDRYVLEKIDTRNTYTQSIQIQMSLQLSASFLKPLNGENLVLGVKIFPNPIDTTVARPSKHLALLIDTSGSMSGERIDAVRRTIDVLIDSLPLGDRLSLIQYSSESSFVLDNSVIGEDRSALHLAVTGLVAEGGTNLENGLMLLRDLIRRTSVDSVFLLTDGHINEGVMSCNALLRILGDNNPPLNTLGFGTDYNVRVLKSLSVTTRGSHTFADVAEMIPAIVGDIIGGLSSEIGKKGTLLIPSGWRCLEMGYQEGNSSYNVGTLIAEKEQWIILEGPVDNTLLGNLSFSYTDSASKEVTVSIPITDSISALEISEQKNRTEVASAYEKVSDLLENIRYDEAKQLLLDLSAKLSSSISKDRPFVIRLLAQVDEMLEEFKNPLVRQNDGFIPRMISNQVALGIQRGIVSRIHSNGPDERQFDETMESFSSPAQRSATATMTNRYSQQVSYN